MLLVLIFHVLISFNTAFYEKGTVVANRAQMAWHVMGKCGGLEIFGILNLFLLWMAKLFDEDY